MFSELKPYAYLGILTAVIAAFAGFWHEGKKAGYNEAVVEQKGIAEKDADERIEKITAEFNIKITRARKAATDFESRLIKLQSEKPKEVTVYVEKIKTLNPDCSRINGFSELWNGIRANYQPQ